jgi:hypothetical protein
MPGSPPVTPHPGPSESPYHHQLAGFVFYQGIPFEITYIISFLRLLWVQFKGGSMKCAVLGLDCTEFGYCFMVNMQ